MPRGATFQAGRGFAKLPLRLGGKVQLARDLYTVLDGPSNRAAILVHLEHTFYSLAVFFVGGQVKSNRDPLAHEHFVLGLYLTRHVGVEAARVEGNLARYQRASEGPEQSATCCCDQVVERAGMGFFHIGRDAVVLGNLAVDSKEDRLFFGR